MGGFAHGLNNLGNGCYAWLQPDGGWGLANSGLVADSGQSLIVDTLYDLKTTQAMLDGYRAATPAARQIDIVVNTHANGDHTFGNQLVSDARIITSKAAAEDMPKRTPEDRARLMRNWRDHGEQGTWVHETYAELFDFEGIIYTGPTESFEREMTLNVGTKELHLKVLGPAHTRGDLLVYSPADRIVWTGDLVFNNAHPAIWAGPVNNWIDACDAIMAMDIDIVVPGHGALTDKAGVSAMRDYLVYFRDQVRERFDAGLSEADTVSEICIDAFRDWKEPERIVINVSALFCEFSGGAHVTESEDLYRRIRSFPRNLGCQCRRHRLA